MQSPSLWPPFCPPFFSSPNQVAPFLGCMLTLPVSYKDLRFPMSTAIFYYNSRTFSLGLLFFILFSLCNAWLHAFLLVPISCYYEHRPSVLHFLSGYALGYFFSIYALHFSQMATTALIFPIMLPSTTLLLSCVLVFPVAISLSVQLQPVMTLVLTKAQSDLWQLPMNLYDSLQFAFMKRESLPFFTALWFKTGRNSFWEKGS